MHATATASDIRFNTNGSYDKWDEGWTEGYSEGLAEQENETLKKERLRQAHLLLEETLAVLKGEALSVVLAWGPERVEELFDLALEIDAYLAAEGVLDGIAAAREEEAQASRDDGSDGSEQVSAVCLGAGGRPGEATGNMAQRLVP
jgi:hypothetical protein